QQASLGPLQAAAPTLCVQSVFLVAVGALAWAAARRGHSAITRLALDLERAERELDTARALSAVGELAARRAHSVKSTIHSLRGFAHLIADRLTSDVRDLEALEGIHIALDRLEQITRDSLKPNAEYQLVDSRELLRVIDDVISEVGKQQPAIGWVRPDPD